MKMKNYENVLLQCMYLIEMNFFSRKLSLYSGIHEGRQLMANSDSQSYAAELEVLSKDEV
jgi:hypothetical protein